VTTPESRYFLSHLGVVNALGAGISDVAEALFAGDTSGMVLESGWLPDAPARVGRARASLHAIVQADDDNRNNRLLLAAAQQIEEAIIAMRVRYGPARIAVVLGTSTSGIAEGEAAFAERERTGQLPASYRYTQQELGAPARFLARHYGLTGPAYTLSTACTSSAKALVSARALLQADLCDVVLAGGADSLCRLTVNGFGALESISPEISQPLSVNRRGINIGEGAALFLVSREPAACALLGIGESSDAHHISAPHPEGRGAEAAMRAALADAGLTASDVDYLNLHATATRKNDQMESLAVARIFSDKVVVSGTKPLTGHTLGAAGATELAFCWLALLHNRLPPHVWDGAQDPDLPVLRLAHTAATFQRSTQRICMSNSFAFGGSNVSLIIGDVH